MRFHSILFDRPENRVDVDEREEPSFFADLNLDQVLESMTAGRREYNLKPFFYAPLHDVEAVHYRHDILRDLEKDAVFESVGAFARKMREMRKHLAQAEKLHYKYQKERWFLDAVEIYCDAVSALTEELTRLDVQSRGFLAFREYLTNYTESDGFTALAGETQKLQDALADVRFCSHIKGNRVTVSKYEDDADYSADVEETFAKFKQGFVKDYRVKLPDCPNMNHVEPQVLDLVERLYPDNFLTLDDYCARHRAYLDPTVGVFDREVHFYVAYLEYIAWLKSAGLRFCYPQVSDLCKEVYACEAFDVALANKLVPEKSAVVCNDFYLKDPERILVVTGPNQGVGLAHLMMQCGMFVPAESFRANVCGGVFTHYKREEDATMKSGKLDEELSRMSKIANKITPNGLLLCNESFASTNEREGSEIAPQIVRALVEAGIKVLFVTHLFDLARGFYLAKMDTALFLRADRQSDGRRTFRLLEGEPLPTSYGEDLYRRIFGTALDAAPAHSRA